VIKHHRDFFFPQIEELEAGTPGRLKVTAKSTESNEIYEGEYNTVSVLPFYWPKFHISLQPVFILSVIFGSVSNPSVVYYSNIFQTFYILFSEMNPVTVKC